MVIDLSSIGTLFAFVLVCGGVLVLENSKNPPRPKFKTPYINGRYLVPMLYVSIALIIYRYFTKDWNDFFSLEPRPDEEGHMQAGWGLFKHKIPMILFLLTATALAVLAFVKRLSLIPVLGLLTCFYLMTQLGITNWLRFQIWLIVGLAIYFLYSRTSSKLHRAGASK